MTKSEYKVIGVMSGTSLDGIDLVYTKFNYDTGWHYEIRYAETTRYSPEWVEILRDLVSKSPDQLKIIDEKYTDYLANVISKFIKKYEIDEIDAVCSHGHTALHQPISGLTYQIGNNKCLAKRIKAMVVCDFRVQDVNLGGQGAPLVPIGDQLLFNAYDFCLNLGGFANISMEIENSRIAYDICPVNTVLNYYSRILGFSYDNKGKIASKGKLEPELLEELNNLEYYQLTYPKSLGLEWVKQKFLPRIEHFNLSPGNVLRTLSEHIAIQISNIFNKDETQTVLVTGGGAYNVFLIDRLCSMTSAKLIIPDKVLINYKEALIFGLLGVLKLRNEINCLSSVTGARKDHSSGVIFYP